MQRRVFVSLLLLAALGVVFSTPRLGAGAPVGHEALVPPDWLLLDRVDASGRTPFNPSRVQARYLFPPDAAPPAVGDPVEGTEGREVRWRRVSTAEDGTVAAHGAAVAYAPVNAPSAGIWMAEVLRAGVLFVNGEPHAGDVYGHGIVQVPVRLEAGRNECYAAGFRGDFRIRFERPRQPVFLATGDATLPEISPDRPAGRPLGPAALLAVNASPDPVEVRIAVLRDGEGSGPAWMVSAPVPMPPCGLAKVPFSLPTPRPGDAGGAPVVDACLLVRGVPVDRSSFPLTRRDAGEAWRETFLSAIDGSAQYYGVLAPTPAGRPPARSGLVLSLHGAGVDARAQAAAYAPKPDYWIVAPTNRRRFGFDWQDWGRLDAYEVLADALSWTGADPLDVHLTGHSMGGHGTWHLAANDPDGFASAAPSAGWISFDTYGGRPRSRLRPLWDAADRASLTLDLLENFRDLPLYVLHGLEDDNVPPDQARQMERALDGIARDATFHYQPGAGHWWNEDPDGGADCVDWPGIFALFRRTRIDPDPAAFAVEVADLSFPPSAAHGPVVVQQPLRYGAPCRIRGHREAGTRAYVLETGNVRRFVLRLPTDTPLRTVRIDGQEVGLPGDAAAAAFVRLEGRWVPDGRVPPHDGEKRPERMGPFRRAFDRGFVLVYGTTGSESENAAALCRARYDAEVWRYRANGLAPCLSDAAWLEDRERWADRNVILYGNADTNAAWDVVLPGDCPLRVARGVLRIGARTYEGEDLAALFAYPRRDSDTALVGVVAGTGTGGLRLTARVPYFASGVGIPDYVVFGPEILERGDEGVRVAGFFDVRWRLAD